MANVGFDDSTTSLRFGGGQWSGVIMDRFFGGSAAWPAFAADENGDTGSYGSLSFAFRGTGVAFFGNTPPAQASQSIMVSIDGGIPYNTSYMDPAPPSSRQWYQSPTLPDSIHNITIDHIASTSVDFIVVTAGLSTPLSGEKLIVDDNDTSMIEYNEDWTQNTNIYTSNDNPVTGLPYGNSTHQATTPGASATFRFSGSSVALYGIFSWQTLGSLSVVYTIDGSPTTQTYSVTPTTPEFKAGARQRENFLFFSNDSLTPGDHTIIMEVTRIVNQSFALDYILYSPSFATLAAKPNLTQSTSATASTTISPAPTITPVPTENSSPGDGPPVGAIIGGLFGGFGFLLLLFLMAWVCLWRRKRSNPDPASSPPRPQALTFEPFTLPSSSAATTGSKSALPAPSNRTRLDSGPEDPTAEPLLSPRSMSQHKSSPSASTFFSTISPSMAASGVAARNMSPTQLEGEGDAGVGFRNRMQELQELVLELNREIASGGENASQVAELRARIAELARRDTEVAGEVRRRDSEIGSIAPPAYEPRRD